MEGFLRFRPLKFTINDGATPHSSWHVTLLSRCSDLHERNVTWRKGCYDVSDSAAIYHAIAHAMPSHQAFQQVLELPDFRFHMERQLGNVDDVNREQPVVLALEQRDDATVFDLALADLYLELVIATGCVPQGTWRTYGHEVERVALVRSVHVVARISASPRPSTLSQSWMAYSGFSVNVPLLVSTVSTSPCPDAKRARCCKRTVSARRSAPVAAAGMETHAMADRRASLQHARK